MIARTSASASRHLRPVSSTLEQRLLIYRERGFGWTKSLPRKAVEMRGKLFAKREVFAENPANGTDFLDREDLAGGLRPTLRDRSMPFSLR
jgi:hypothetical protein